MRKYEISCTIILQSLSQIKAKYDKIWEVLVGNCVRTKYNYLNYICN
ncbi:MAG: TraG/TraD/VirD4 family protein [Clostridiales bacterium]|nr:TraG/TraD/VirD4 family protein [Clostridiales bacterium]